MKFELSLLFVRRINNIKPFRVSGKRFLLFGGFSL